MTTHITNLVHATGPKYRTKTLFIEQVQKTEHTLSDVTGPNKKMHAFLCNRSKRKDACFVHVTGPKETRHIPCSYSLPRALPRYS